MSFLAGGSECAANVNPLAQLSKRAEFDTSLQNSIRNGSSLHNTDSRLNSIHNESLMNQNDKTMMQNFMMDQNSAHSGLHNQNNFNFEPLSHELNNVINHNQHQQHQQQQQPHHQNIQQQSRMNLQPSQNWSSEFINSSPVSLSQNQNQTSTLNRFQSSIPMNQNPLRMNQIPISMRMNMNMNMNMNTNMHLQQQNSSNLQSQTNIQNDKSDWEDSFKEIEQQFDNAINDDVIEINDNKSVLDDVKINNPLSFNEKYHEEYVFEENNEFLHNPNAYEIGCKLMEGGAKLSEAALAFEAAVQEDSKHTDAWLKLGQVQIQNEKELLGITALENCLLSDNKNLTALMSLAISYVNEGYDNAAFKTFENWIETKYPDVVLKAKNENPNDTADDRYSLNKRITNLFLRAAQLSPTGANVDADIQTGLGVLFYAMEEYDKTLDCFQAAIRCNPNDALSWNRLGASYANSNRPEQAIEAYSKALQLNPNFVRARYNLGVSFINMGMYKDAVDHLLTGLSMHEVESPNDGGMLVSDTEQSSNLIETLKRAFLAMDRRDLIDQVRPGMNITKFRQQFSL